MAFNSLADFFSMGGYAFYVWLAYGISFSALFVLVTNTIFKRKKILMKVEQRIVSQQRIKNARNMEGTL